MFSVLANLAEPPGVFRPIGGLGLIQSVAMALRGIRGPWNPFNTAALGGALSCRAAVVWALGMGSHPAMKNFSNKHFWFQGQKKRDINRYFHSMSSLVDSIPIHRRLPKAFERALSRVGSTLPSA